MKNFKSLIEYLLIIKMYGIIPLIFQAFLFKWQNLSFPIVKNINFINLFFFSDKDMTLLVMNVSTKNRL
jgi:hypothetical protein